MHNLSVWTGRPLGGWRAAGGGPPSWPRVRLLQPRHRPQARLPARVREGWETRGPNSGPFLVVLPADVGLEAGSFRKVVRELICAVIAVRSTCYFYYHYMHLEKVTALSFAHDSSYTWFLGCAWPLACPPSACMVLGYSPGPMCRPPLPPRVSRTTQAPPCTRGPSPSADSAVVLPCPLQARPSCPHLIQ